MASDTFSVRWTGDVLADYAETYTFSTTSSDGVKLWGDGQLVIDNWTNPSSQEQSGQIALAAGWHDSRLDYCEAWAQANVSLSYSSPSTPKQIIPSSHLDPDGLQGQTLAEPAAGQLRAAQVSGAYDEWYSYDALGNLTSKGGVASSYPAAGQPRPHAPASAGGQAYSYDANGNLTGRPGWSLSWNADNQPTSWRGERRKGRGQEASAGRLDLRRRPGHASPRAYSIARAPRKVASSSTAPARARAVAGAAGSPGSQWTPLIVRQRRRRS
jgi:hypothetical protein